MNKKIISKLLESKAFSRIYSQNVKAIKAARHQAFVKSLVMLFKDAKALESKGDSNAKKSWTNPFSSPANAAGISQNDYSNSGSWGKSTNGNSKSGFKPASLKQIKYIKYLIYVLSKDYSSSSYSQIAKEVCGVKTITTSNISRSKAYKSIQDLKGLLPKSKPKSKSTTKKASSSLPF